VPAMTFSRLTTPAKLRMRSATTSGCSTTLVAWLTTPGTRAFRGRQGAIRVIARCGSRRIRRLAERRCHGKKCRRHRLGKSPVPQGSSLHAAGSGRCLHFGKCACKGNSYLHGHRQGSRRAEGKPSRSRPAGAAESARTIPPPILNEPANAQATIAANRATRPACWSETTPRVIPSGEVVSAGKIGEHEMAAIAHAAMATGLDAVEPGKPQKVACSSAAEPVLHGVPAIGTVPQSRCRERGQQTNWARSRC